MATTQQKTAEVETAMEKKVWTLPELIDLSSHLDDVHGASGGNIESADLPDS